MAAKSNLMTMSVCLTLVCLVCSALLAGVYAITADPIAKAESEAIKSSVAKVLPQGGEISESRPLEVGGQASEYYTMSDGGNVVAYAVKSSVVGFGGPLVLMVGVTADGQVFNTAVLSHNETPGLGAKCASDASFTDQFKGFDAGSKSLSVKKDGGDVDAITASTITSRAYTLAVRNAVEAVGRIKGGE
ncbi:MAG: RnfABCDGE type electron transport complex subunit G [Bacteroidales bacterium]|nr:RnfABCDGE type electron transport complex subunit G [Bacteroidales bacterium]